MKAPTPKTHPKLAAALRRFAKRLTSPKFPSPVERAKAKRLLGRAP